MPVSSLDNLAEKVGFENIFLRSIGELKKQANPSYIAHLAMAVRAILLEFLDIGKRYYITLNSTGLDITQQIIDAAPLLHIALTSTTLHDLATQKIQPIPTFLDEKISIEGVPVRQLRLFKILWQDFCTIYQGIQSNNAAPVLKKRLVSTPIPSHRILKTWLKLPSSVALFTSKVCHWLRLKKWEVRLLNNIQETWTQLDEDIRHRLVYGNMLAASRPKSTGNTAKIASHPVLPKVVSSEPVVKGDGKTSAPTTPQQDSGLKLKPIPEIKTIPPVVPQPEAAIISKPAPEIKTIIPATPQPDAGLRLKTIPEVPVASKPTTESDAGQAKTMVATQPPTPENRSVIPEQLIHAYDQLEHRKNTIGEDKTQVMLDLIGSEPVVQPSVHSVSSGDAIYVPSSEEETYTSVLEGTEAVIEAGRSSSSPPASRDIIDPVHVEVSDGESALTAEDVFFSPPWEESELVDIPANRSQPLNSAEILDVDFSNNDDASPKPIPADLMPKNEKSSSSVAQNIPPPLAGPVPSSTSAPSIQPPPVSVSTDAAKPAVVSPVAKPTEPAASDAAKPAVAIPSDMKPASSASKAGETTMPSPPIDSGVKSSVPSTPTPSSVVVPPSPLEKAASESAPSPAAAKPAAIPPPSAPSEAVSAIAKSTPKDAPRKPPANLPATPTKAWNEDDIDDFSEQAVPTSSHVNPPLRPSSPESKTGKEHHEKEPVAPAKPPVSLPVNQKVAVEEAPPPPSQQGSFTQRLSTTLQKRQSELQLFQTRYFQKFTILHTLAKEQSNSEVAIPPGSQVLTNQEIVRIMEGAFTILSQRGVRLPYDVIGKNLAELGCNGENGTVKIPEPVLWKVLEQLPRYNRERYPYTFLIAGHSLRQFDYERRMSQEGNIAEARYLIGLMNALPNIAIASTGILPCDVPHAAADVVSVALLCKYCNKPFIQEIYSLESAQCIKEILHLMSDKEAKEMLFIMRPVAPLLYKKAQLQVVEFAAKSQWPMLLCSSPEIGLHAPLDLSTIVSLVVADWLAQYTILTACQHDREVVLQASLRINHQDTTIYHSPEIVRIILALRQVANYLNCPFVNGSSCNITAWNLQTAWDKIWSNGLNCLLNNACTGYAGMIGEDFSPEQLVLDHWVSSVWNRINAGIRVNTETLDRKKIQEWARSGHLPTTEINKDTFLQLLGIRGIVPNDLPGSLHQEVVDIFSKGKPQSLLSQDKGKELEQIVDARMQQLGD